MQPLSGKSRFKTHDKNKYKTEGWAYRSTVSHMLSMYRVLASVPTTTKEKENKYRYSKAHSGQKAKKEKKELKQKTKKY